MKSTASKNNQKALNKFENLALISAKKKNVKGGSDPIIFQDYLDG